ncbi:MAG: DUF456 domain-containing protein [Phycisphaerales bacterium]|nr:DUF456 domain-containing protein [Phycisphaerales bacterium]
MAIVLGIAFTFTAAACVVSTLFMLPGTWVMLLAAVGLNVYQPETFSWWTIGVAAALAVGGEIAETVSGAAGARAANGSRRSMAGAIVGGIVGAVAGTFVVPVPMLGTIVGGAAGAGVGAGLLEATKEGHSGGDAVKVASGAAVGRFFATVFKMAFALAMFFVLVVAVFV